MPHLAFIPRKSGFPGTVESAHFRMRKRQQPPPTKRQEKAPISRGFFDHQILLSILDDLGHCRQFLQLRAVARLLGTKQNYSLVVMGDFARSSNGGNAKTWSLHLPPSPGNFLEIKNYHTITKNGTPNLKYCEETSASRVFMHIEPRYTERKHYI